MLTACRQLETAPTDAQTTPARSELESPPPDTQIDPRANRQANRRAARRGAALALLAARPAEFARGGCVVPTYRTAAGERRGPYFELQFRGGGKLHKLYLGRDESLAAEIRAALERLQAPLRLVRDERRRRERQWSGDLSVMRQLKANFALELDRLGLTLKGGEIRGWRSLARRRS